MHETGRGAVGGERTGEGGWEGLFPSLNHSLLVLGSHTDTSCTSHFQGNSSPLPPSRPHLWAEQKPDRQSCEVTILSIVCTRSPQGQAAMLQEGRDRRGSLAWAAGTEHFSEEV